MFVADLMTTDLVRARPDMTLKDVDRLFMANAISRRRLWSTTASSSG